ncbi:hypothetical protein TNCV_4408111 [Trichonephila clavipes]|nr:hypothetical protein TNCV_4408111 [Trichonephila clavipes]
MGHDRATQKWLEGPMHPASLRLSITGLDVRLSLAVALSILLVTVRFVWFHLNFEGGHSRGGQGPSTSPTSREDLQLDGYLEYSMPQRHYTFTNIHAFFGIPTQALRHCIQSR